tara:strand:- start:14587 stop:15363 length:777 start_codon:yes stop_codon:yes gene_type:complete
MFDLYLVEPHYILLSILLLLLLYKILASFVITNDTKNFDSIVVSSTKNPEGYKDKTMISNSFKEWWSFAISPIEEMLIKSEVNPNFLTLISFVVSIFTAYLYANGLIFFASIFILAGSSFDILDGRIARATNKVSTKGAFLDSCLDRFSEITIMFGLLIYYFPTHFSFVIFLTVCFSLLVSYIKAVAINMNLDSNIGIMQRPERVVYLGIGGIISSVLDYYGINLFDINHFILLASISIILIFSIISSVQRMWKSLKS